jgi:hypothetical protein
MLVKLVVAGQRVIKLLLKPRGELRNLEHIRLIGLLLLE